MRGALAVVNRAVRGTSDAGMRSGSLRRPSPLASSWRGLSEPATVPVEIDSPFRPIDTRKGVCVVGAGGRMGKIRAQGIMSNPGTFVASVVDPDTPRVKALAEHLNVPAFWWVLRCKLYSRLMAARATRVKSLSGITRGSLLALRSMLRAPVVSLACVLWNLFGNCG